MTTPPSGIGYATYIGRSLPVPSSSTLRVLPSVCTSAMMVVCKPSVETPATALFSRSANERMNL